MYGPAGLFGYLDRQQSLAALTELCTLCDEAETVEIHVGAADDCHEAFSCALQLVVDDVAFEAR